MADLQDVNMEGVAPATSFQVVPDGEYTMIMSNSEKKTTKAGDGAYLGCEFTIQSGQYNGSKLFHNFNLWNKNEVAVNIAKGELVALCMAIVGKPMVTDSSHLHDKKFIGTVKIGKNQNGEPRSEMVVREGKVRPLGAATNTTTATTETKTKGEGKKTPW